jgi:hypothetical protein
MLDLWWSCCVHYSVRGFLWQKCCSETCPVASFQLVSVSWCARFPLLWFMISKCWWCLTEFLDSVNIYAWSFAGYTAVIASVTGLTMTTMWWWILQGCRDSVVNLLKQNMIPRFILLGRWFYWCLLTWLSVKVLVVLRCMTFWFCAQQQFSVVC